MFRSIRAELLAWQAVILVAVVFGFGTTLYLRVAYATRERVDADLLGAAQLVALRLQQSAADQVPEIPEAYRQRFGERAQDRPYLVVWDGQGRVRMASEPVPDDLRPARELPAAEGPHPYHARNRGPFREVIVRGPSAGQVLVGRQMGRERNELRRLLAWLVGSGVAIVALGLVGAGVLARQILTPVAQIAGLAERISASNLAERIDEVGSKAELGRLAQVLNRMFGRLEAAFERQARFTADASHELRTPTAVVLAQSELALAHERSPEEYQEALEACQRAARRMESLVEGLLTLARIDAGQGELRTEVVELLAVVENAVALVRPMADRKQIEMTCELECVQVHGDAARLGQVVVNLLSNAVHYNPPHGQIHIGLARQAHQAVLAVEDTGIGIGAEELPHVFERFYRVDPARTGETGGVGLGLAICQEIVHRHGGTIEVASVLGVGTTFTVRLPCGNP